MKIVVISGQDKVDLKQYIENIEKVEPSDVLVFPELSGKHPATLFDYIKDVTKQHINDNISLYCVTYSDHVLNAIRLTIKDYDGNVDAITHQVCNNGNVIEATILKDGKLTQWVDGVWDQWDKALMELL